MANTLFSPGEAGEPPANSPTESFLGHGVSLDEAQMAAVMHPGPSLRILAGPGSGKTRVLSSRIVRRIQDGSADPRRVLALTFTRRAAAELRARLLSAGVRDIANVGTFHAVALQQLRQHRIDNNRLGPEIIASRPAVLRSLAPRGHQTSSLIAEIERAASRGLTAAGLAKRGRSQTGSQGPAAELYALYEKHKKRKGLLDFDDILGQCTKLLREDDRFAAAQRWRFRHLFVDEFQDVNKVQFDLLKAWLGERDDICVVGDPDQAIYGWNGADATYLTDFTTWFPAATTVTLGTNHRSAAPVVAAASAVLGSREVNVRKPVGPQPTVSAHPTDANEAEETASRLRWEHGQSQRWGSHAVLARTNAQLEMMAEALSNSAIPFRIQGRGSSSRTDGADETMKLLRESGDRFGSVLVDLEIEESTDPAQVSVLALAREYASGSANPTGAGFGQWMRTVRANDVGADVDAIDLVTFHAAKGLEWKHVSIIGFEDGLAPMGPSEEERRLAYVAITRAEISLHLSWCRTRPKDGLVEDRLPSPWLELIEAAAAPVVPAKADQIKSHMANARSATAGDQPPDLSTNLVGEGGTDSDRDRFNRLTEWRNSAAKARRVAPQAIVRDDHLAELSATNPSTVKAVMEATGLSKLRLRRDAPAILEALRGP